MSPADFYQTVGLLTWTMSATNNLRMRTFKSIREQLSLTQAEIGRLLGVTQGSVSFYENGKTVPPEVARRLIEVARAAGQTLTFDDIYAGLDLTARA